MIPKRAFWAGTGYAAGAATSIWAVRKVKRVAARYTPSAVVVRARDGAIDTGRRVRDAVAEGRDAARRREAELRAALDGSDAAGTDGLGAAPVPLRLVAATPEPAQLEAPARPAAPGGSRGGRLRRVR
ncbi:MAG: hypothetical protein ACKOZL_10790 [Actinomycetes bacterium]